MTEAPNTVHGRLLEAVHISGYTFERACSELEWLLEEHRWKEVGGGFDDVHAFLATIDLSEFKIVVERRKNLAEKIEAIGASQRATAKLLGVDHSTISRDLSGGANATPAPEMSSGGATPEVSGGANATPESFVQASGRAVAEEDDPTFERCELKQLEVP